MKHCLKKKATLGKTLNRLTQKHEAFTITFAYERSMWLTFSPRSRRVGRAVASDESPVRRPSAMRNFLTALIISSMRAVLGGRFLSKTCDEYHDKPHDEGVEH